MMGRAAIALLAAAQAITVLMHPQGGVQTPTFRTQADLVVVDATVLTAGKPVSGLQPHDFRVLDNGVPQRVEFVAPSAIPLDVSLLVETAIWHDGGGPLRFWNDVQVVAKRLRTGDRIGLSTFATVVYEEFPLQPAPVKIPDRPTRVSGDPRLCDALRASPAMAGMTSPSR